MGRGAAREVAGLSFGNPASPSSDALGVPSASDDPRDAASVVASPDAESEAFSDARGATIDWTEAITLVLLTPNISVGVGTWVSVGDVSLVFVHTVVPDERTLKADRSSDLMRNVRSMGVPLAARGSDVANQRRFHIVDG